jgi:N4-gp56 family major capsid protein
MASGAIGTNHQTVTTAADFIPELWSDEVIAGYKKNLVVGNLVSKIAHKGKKGDQIHIPKPTRGSATAKSANAKVAIQSDTHSKVDLSIDKHYEYSVLIEDITEVQALNSLRRFYTDDAGYALATQVDTDLFTLTEALQSGTVGGSGANSWETAWTINSAGTGIELYTGNASNARDLTDGAIRALILKLDNADVPMDNRSMIIPPICANDLLGINRFTEQQYIGSGDAIRTGKIGMIYGIDVFISSNCPTASLSTAPYNTDRVGVLMHKDALALVEQMSVRSQTQYKQEYLGDLFTADTIYGVGELRNDAGLAFVVPAS